MCARRARARRGKAQGIVAPWPPRQHGEQRRLAQRERSGGLVKVDVGRLFDAPGAVAVIDAIEIVLEDRALGAAALQPTGQHHLAQLAPPAARGVRAEPHQLHRDRRAPVAPTPKVEPERTAERAPIDPRVPVEGVVLGRECRLDQPRRDAVERAPALTQARARRFLPQGRAGRVEDDQRPRRMRFEQRRREVPQPYREPESRGRERDERCAGSKDAAGPAQPSAQRHAPAPRQGLAMTSIRSRPVRAWIAGSYMRAATVGGRAKLPTAIARSVSS